MNPDTKNSSVAMASATFSSDGVRQGFSNADETTRFEIGSISKLFTGILLSQAELDGLCDLDAPLSESLSSHVPSFFGKQMTLRQLANHTSGLPRLPLAMYLDANGPQPYAKWDSKRTLNAVSRTPLLRAPGSLYSYSNFGFAVLGLVLENLRKASYGDLVSSLAAELGCPDIRLPSLEDGPFTPKGHDASGVTVTPWRFDTFAAAGGLTSTIGGLTQFVQKCLTPLNSPALANSMVERSTVKKRAANNGGILTRGGSALGACLMATVFPESVFAPIVGIGASAYVGGPLNGLIPTASWLIASDAFHDPRYVIGQRLGFGLVATGISQNFRRNRDTQQMAIAWHVSRSQDNRELLWHNGGTAGFRSFLGIIPSQGKASIVLSAKAVSVDTAGLELLR
jgi:CubicO group peptidase (beta-lactamase class C family)